MKPQRRLLTGPVALAVVAAVHCTAGPFQYINGDLLACFRTEGGATDLVVNLGPATQLENLPWGSRIRLSEVTADRLAAALPSLDNIRWAVLGALRGNTNYPQYPIQTLWVTSPVPEPGLPGPAWKRRGPFTQGATASQIEAIGQGALAYASQIPAGINNTNKAIVIPSQDPAAYSTLTTTEGNLAGTFQGTVESVSPEPFDTLPLTAVLYRLIPGSGTVLNTPGDWLGVFEFTPEGTLSFLAGPPIPRIASITRTSETTTLMFPTIPGFRYRFRYAGTEALTVPVDAWSTSMDSVEGTGAQQTLQHPTPADTQLYVLEVIR